MYVQLSKQACQVLPVDKLKAEYEKALALKNRISKSRRAPAGVPLPAKLDAPTTLHKKSTSNWLKGGSLDGETMSFSQVRNMYYLQTFASNKGTSPIQNQAPLLQRVHEAPILEGTAVVAVKPESTKSKI